MRDLLALCPGMEVAVTDPDEVRMLSNVNTREDLAKVKNQGFP